MPRQALLDVPGALHHIMVRGIEKTDLFRDDQDRSFFLERLGLTGALHGKEGQKEEFDQRILGGGEFVNQILKESEERYVRQLKHNGTGKTIQKIIDEECRRRGINPLELRGGGKRRKVSETRATIAMRGREELGLSAAAIARQVGVSTTAITKGLERREQAAGR